MVESGGREICQYQGVMEGRAVTLEAERVMINPGSVGQPRDGDPRASYAILDTEHNTVTHHRVTYPLEVTQDKMLDYDLPPRLAMRLAYGW
jgi:diadenosine tetraphosphatase ApaH/serine/threonine PP2A family protein phosphatase